jgi:hypothetical protein
MLRNVCALSAAFFILLLSVNTIAQAQAPAAEPGATELWASIRSSSNPTDFENFLQRYPDHAFATFARSKLNSLRPQAASPPQPGQPATTPQVRQAVTPPPGGPQSIFGGPAASPQAPVPDLAVDLQSALQSIGCYSGGIDGDWGRGSQAALQRFNVLTGSNLPLTTPTQEALATVSNWGGGNCAVVAKRAAPKATKKKKASKKRKKKTAASSRKKPATGGSGMRVIIGGGGVGVGIGF